MISGLSNGFGFKRQPTEEELNYEAEIVELNPGKDENSGPEIKTKKLTPSTTSLPQEGQLLFCISVDGSVHSELAFDVVTKEFFAQNSKMMVVHVYNEKMNSNYNYNNRKETVIDKYATKIYKYSNQINFLVEDRSDKSHHALEQVLNIAKHYKSNYLISGYYGIKGQKSSDAELSKGVNYLLAYSKIPTIIFKEIQLREDKKEKGYNWLIILDKQYTANIRCFKAFIPLINAQKDYVQGFGLIEANSFSMTDDMEPQFMKEIQDNNIKNFAYECSTYNKIASNLIQSKVNYGTINYDFVVLFNNRDKHIMEGNNSDVTNIVKQCKACICIYNF